MYRRIRSCSTGRAAARAAAAAVVTAVAVVAAPGAATAAPAESVVPLLDCVSTNPDETWTAVFGYDNRTASVVEIPVGPDNQLTPTRSGVPPLTTFEPGVHHGVFSVVVTKGAGAMWHLDRDNLAARVDSAPACPSATPLPAEGNGLGLVMILAGAAVAGALVIRRSTRRSSAATAAGTGAEMPGAEAETGTQAGNHA